MSGFLLSSNCIFSFLNLDTVILRLVYYSLIDVLNPAAVYILNCVLVAYCICSDRWAVGVQCGTEGRRVETVERCGAAKEVEAAVPYLP